jgi:predicted Fe-S protein YdhL (DUF1289 family)
MARRADYGLMIWDGASPGTALNVLRLAAIASPCIVYDTMCGVQRTVRNVPDWQEMIRGAWEDVLGQTQARMTEDERTLSGG